jgi:hypothetical protein
MPRGTACLPLAAIAFLSMLRGCNLALHFHGTGACPHARRFCLGCPVRTRWTREANEKRPWRVSRTRVMTARQLGEAPPDPSLPSRHRAPSAVAYLMLAQLRTIGHSQANNWDNGDEDMLIYVLCDGPVEGTSAVYTPPAFRLSLSHSHPQRPFVVDKPSQAIPTPPFQCRIH